MLKINKNYLKLPAEYFFNEIETRVYNFRHKNPDNEIISLGIGDVTLPLVPAVTDRMHAAVKELSNAETFKGYGAEEGYKFLRELICTHDYKEKNLNIELDEIFVSDGMKDDLANIIELFDSSIKISVCDPVYPAYVSTNIIAGRTGKFRNGRWSNVIYLKCTPENDFLPELPNLVPDIIYLCYPNNPTGAVMDHKTLKMWVTYAKTVGAVIFYDAAYETFITGDYPHSIYEVDGAKDCAIEFKSYSKTAGFTGIRCGYTVIPKDINFYGTKISINEMWKKHKHTKTNGINYIAQAGAAAIYTEEGKKQVKESISYYMENAHYIFNKFKESGAQVFGGQNAPYIWVKNPSKLGSWQIFDLLLKKAGVICTPGSGFGPNGEGYTRFSAFNSHEKTKRAIERVIDLKIFNKE